MATYKPYTKEQGQNNTLFKHEKVDQEQKLTNRVIELLEKSELSNWERPWLTINHRAKNILTGNAYAGVNSLSLALAGYSDPRFATLNQYNEYAKANNLTLDFSKLKGQGIAVFKAIDITLKGKDEAEVDGVEEGKSKSFTKLKYAGSVFNASIVGGIPEYEAQPVQSLFTPHEEAEILRKAWEKIGLQIEHGGNRAFYSPLSNTVRMPIPESFKSTEDYYSTLMHELVHASGSKLGRDLSGKFGSTAYAKEELVAEMGSLFLAVHLGIRYETSNHEAHAAYMKSWLKILKDDKKFIFKAASQASQSSSFQIDLIEDFKLVTGLLFDRKHRNNDEILTTHITPIKEKEMVL